MTSDKTIKLKTALNLEYQIQIHKTLYCIYTATLKTTATLKPTARHDQFEIHQTLHTATLTYLRLRDLLKVLVTIPRDDLTVPVAS